MMKLTGLFSIPDFNQDSYRIIREKAEIEINKRSFPDIPVYPLLLLALMGTTQIHKVFPKETLFFLFLTLLICLFRVSTALAFEEFRRQRRAEAWRILFYTGNMAAGGSWGIAMGFILKNFAISWTSLLSILLTCAIGANLVPSFLTNIRTFGWHLLLLLFPSVLVSFIFLEGVQGISLGVFFLVFMGLLLFQGKIHCRNYWRAEKGRERMRSMLDTMPGILIWVDSQFTYQGINRKYSELWEMAPQYFVGQKLGFKGQDIVFKDWALEIFSRQDQSIPWIREFEMESGGKKRSFLMVAEKCPAQNEIIFMGFEKSKDFKRPDQLLNGLKTSPNIIL